MLANTCALAETAAVSLEVVAALLLLLLLLLPDVLHPCRLQMQSGANALHGRNSRLRQQQKKQHGVKHAQQSLQLQRGSVQRRRPGSNKRAHRRLLRTDNRCEQCKRGCPGASWQSWVQHLGSGWKSSWEQQQQLQVGWWLKVQAMAAAVTSLAASMRAAG
jgi:hypothetical protein